LAAGRHDEFHQAASHVLGASDRPGKTNEDSGNADATFWRGFQILTSRPLFLIRLIGASLSWFLMDFAYYGNTVSSPIVLAAISPDQSLVMRTLTQLAAFSIAAAPGYLIAAALMDRLGRKSIQIIGFAMMAAAFGAIALMPGLDKLLLPFPLVYGISNFFAEFGPNATTFVYPAELVPVEARTTGQGIAAAAGKLGGFVGVFLFPIFMAWNGLFAAEFAAASVSVFGIIVTLAMLPETKGMSLEELSADQTAAPVPADANT
jgi:MFS transporter, PHS family, inorganic phosphate transporter